MCIWRHKLCNSKTGVGPTFTWSNEPWCTYWIVHCIWFCIQQIFRATLTLTTTKFCLSKPKKCEYKERTCEPLCNCFKPILDVWCDWITCPKSLCSFFLHGFGRDKKTECNSKIDKWPREKCRFCVPACEAGPETRNYRAAMMLTRDVFLISDFCKNYSHTRFTPACFFFCLWVMLVLPHPEICNGVETGITNQIHNRFQISNSFHQLNNYYVSK